MLEIYIVIISVLLIYIVKQWFDKKELKKKIAKCDIEIANYRKNITANICAKYGAKFNIDDIAYYCGVKKKVYHIKIHISKNNHVSVHYDLGSPFINTIDFFDVPEDEMYTPDEFLTSREKALKDELETIKQIKNNEQHNTNK